ncbi:ankyrin repeat domain-containing protein [bacterium]|nr:ankyrin repeat domain-containing protein [bacterium]
MSGVCPKCGSDNPPGASFCGHCGFMLGSAPGGPGLERLAGGDPSGQSATPAGPVAAPPGSAPGTGEIPVSTAFPDGTEGAGIWAGSSSSVQPPPAPPGDSTTPSPAWPQPDAQPVQGYSAPPAPKKPDNTLKIIGWVVGGCCGCSVLLFAGFAGLGFYLDKQEKEAAKNGGVVTSTDASSPGLDGGAFAPDGGSAVSMDGMEQVYGIAEAVTAASDAEVTDWAIAQELGEYYQPQDALVFACAAGNAPVAKYLAASEGVDVNAASKTFGSPALHSASYNNYVDCVAILIANGADFNLNAGGDLGTPLHQTAIGNAADSARMLISCGAEIESRNDLGLTPLHDAANANAVEVATLLIANGSGVDVPTDFEGNTALLLAANQGNVEVGQVLIDSGANLNFQEPQYGLTALHSAAFVGSAGFVQMLITAGANPYLRTNDGQSPEDLALAGGHSSVAELLR